MADFMVWLGVLVKKGPATLEKRIIKITGPDKTVGDLLVDVVDDLKLIDSVQGYQTDPDKVSVTASPITLGLLNHGHSTVCGVGNFWLSVCCGTCSGGCRTDTFHLTVVNL
jgi:hypothetical protein